MSGKPDKDVKAVEKYERVVTPDELVAMADSMFKLSRKTPFEQKEELFARFWEENKELCRAYPIVVKMLCFRNEYHSEVFRRHILYAAKASRKTEEEYHDIQASYVKMLYRKICPKKGAAYYKMVYEETLRILREEAKNYKETLAEVREEIAEKNSKYLGELRQELAVMAAAGTIKDGEIIVEADREGPGILGLPEAAPVDSVLTRTAASLFN